MPIPRLGLVVAAAIALAVAGIAVANLFDRELSAEAKGIFERSPRAFSRDSGWALLVGFNAPAGEDPRVYGVRSQAAPSVRKVPRPTRTDELAVRAPAELLCSPESMDCVRSFAAKPQSIDEMAADNAVLLARYDELLVSTGLADVVHGLDAYETFFPGSVVLGVQRIRMSQAGAAAARGRIDHALAWLEADVAFHRRWLDEADTLLSKMLALRAFTRPLVLAGQVARSAPALTPAQVEALARITAPLTRRQRGLAAPMRAETRLFAESLDQLIAGPGAASQVTGAPRIMAEIVSRTVRRNATLNFAAPLYVAWMRLDNVDSPRLARAIEAIQAMERAHLERHWRWAYNYPGRAITAETHYDVARYIWRLRDGDALAALIRCAVALRASGVTIALAARQVSGDPACRDPYLARPFAWDRSKGELSFTAASEGTDKRFGGDNGRVIFAPYPR